MELPGGGGLRRLRSGKRALFEHQGEGSAGVLTPGLDDQEVRPALLESEAHPSIRVSAAIIVLVQELRDSAHRARHDEIRIEIVRPQLRLVAGANLRLELIDREGPAGREHRVSGGKRTADGLPDRDGREVTGLGCGVTRVDRGQNAGEGHEGDEPVEHGPFLGCRGVRTRGGEPVGGSASEGRAPQIFRGI